MTDRKEIIRVLGFIQEYFDNHADAQETDIRKELFNDWSDTMLEAIALLKAQEPRVMTLKEIQKYLDEPDGDKVPLWLEWHSIPQLSGWVLASPVKDLMRRYIDSYNITWRPWTSRPTDVQREAEKWDE